MNIVLDVETSKIPHHLPWVPGSYLSCVGMARDDGFTKSWYFKHDDLTEPPDEPQLVHEIKTEIMRAGRVIGHNLKFDLHWIKFLLEELPAQKYFCTMVADYLLNGQRKIGYSLNKCAERFDLGTKQDKVKMFWDADYDTCQIPLNILDEYLIQDCQLTLNLFQKQFPLIIEREMVGLMGGQQKLMVMLHEMEYLGARIDPVRAEEIYQERLGVLDVTVEHLRKLFEVPDLNLNSNQELSAALYGGIIKRPKVVKVKTTKKVTEKEPYVFYYKDPKKGSVVKYRNVKVDREVLKDKKIIEDIALPRIVDPLEREEKPYYPVNKVKLATLKPTSKKQKEILESIKQHAKIAREVTMYHGKKEGTGILNKVVDGIIHTNFNQTITSTGRLSSSEPNLQNIDATATQKEIFIPRYDVIAAADVSQVEWRSAIWLSQDPVGLHEIREGIDQHADNMQMLFNITMDQPEAKEYRGHAKTFQFRLLYGGSAYGMFMDPNMPPYPVREWDTIVKKYYEKYKVLRQYQQRNIDLVHINGGYLKTITGRVYHFDRFTQPDWNGYVYATQKICNYPNQGLATGDIFPVIMLLARDKIQKRNLKSKVMLQVHDSVILDAFEAELPTLRVIFDEITNELTQVLKKCYGFNFDIPLNIEMEVGPNYRELKPYEKDK